MNQRRKSYLAPITILGWLVWFTAVAGAQENRPSVTIEAEARHSKQKLVLAHYLPWHDCSPSENQYGWHWTMNQFDPSQTDTNGLNVIASHYHPLIGPYDGNDPDLIDYHLQLMKLANIDGFVLDWYGVSDHNDYLQIHQMAKRFVKRATEYGFQFAVCYEDRILVDSQLATLSKAKQRATVAKDLNWLQKNWFRQKNYIRVADRPLLLNFGPIALQTDDWRALRTEFKPFPQLYALPHLKKRAGASGCFQWIPVHGGKASQPIDWKKYLADLENVTDQPLIAAAFAGYHDIYGSVAGGKSYGFLDRADGKTLASTLEIAKRSRAEIVQLITWNDFGEGTMLEPTHEFGFKPLQQIQAAFGRGKSDPASLTLPLKLYHWRKRIRLQVAREKTRSLKNNEAWQRASQASVYLLQGNVERAKAVLRNVSDQD